MAKEIKNLLWAVVLTIIIYLYLTAKSAQLEPKEAENAEVTAVQVPEPTTLKANQETSASAKTIKLVDVNKDGIIVVAVNGELAIIKKSGIVDGLKIIVIDTFYSENKADRAATIIVSEA